MISSIHQLYDVLKCKPNALNFWLSDCLFMTSCCIGAIVMLRNRCCLVEEDKSSIHSRVDVARLALDIHRREIFEDQESIP